MRPTALFILAAAMLISTTRPSVVIAQNNVLEIDHNLLYYVNQAQTHFNIFDIELLRYTAEATTGNFLISPASIKSVLGMILQGAKGTSAVELREHLRLPENAEIAKILLIKLTEKLKLVSTGVNIKVANRIYVSDRYAVKKQFADLLREIHGADIIRENFGQPVSVANSVNAWVDSVTNGKITNLVQPENFASDAMMFLANAVYFKGIWKSRFNKNLTGEACFYVNKECKTVNMMEANGEYNYTFVSELSAQAIELPYLGDKYSLLIVVPTDKNGLTTSFIRNLSYIPLTKIVSDMDQTEVHLRLPQINIKYSEDMVSILKKLGITEIFNKRADLTNIVQNSDSSPHINNVVHKTHLELNEEGSVAAAATSAMVIPLMGSSSARVIVDHPFVFFIRDVETGVVIFEGRYSDPPSNYVSPYNTNQPLPSQNGRGQSRKPGYVPQQHGYTNPNGQPSQSPQLRPQNSQFEQPNQFASPYTPSGQQPQYDRRPTGFAQPTPPSTYERTTTERGQKPRQSDVRPELYVFSNFYNPNLKETPRRF